MRAPRSSFVYCGIGLILKGFGEGDFAAFCIPFSSKLARKPR